MADKYNNCIYVILTVRVYVIKYIENFESFNLFFSINNQELQIGFTFKSVAYLWGGGETREFVLSSKLFLFFCLMHI